MISLRTLHLLAAVLAALLLLGAAGLLFWYFRPGAAHQDRLFVRLAGVTLKAEVADSPAAQVRGLSGHAPLADDEGMVFLFRHASSQRFWMKDMLFPIDIIWIRHGQVVDITANAPVPSGSGQLPTYAPNGPVDTVLEVKAGFAAAHGVVPGTMVGLEKME